MSKQARSFLASLLTLVLARIGFWLFNFNPLRDLPFWSGAALDLTIWTLLWLVLYRVLSRFFPAEAAQPAPGA